MRSLSVVVDDENFILLLVLLLVLIPSSLAGSPYASTTTNVFVLILLFNYGQTVSTLAWQVVARINGASCGLDPTSRYPC